MKRLLYRLANVAILTTLVGLLAASELMAQAPPMLPGSPEQAPVTGGLALLAASGGAYAWMKLRRAGKR
jgi:hypothetical protein